jgi:hypothetical protein
MIVTKGLCKNGPKGAHRRTKSGSKYVAEFSYIRGIICYELEVTGQTINQVYYLEVLERLRENVRGKRPELFTNYSKILNHDNAPHTACLQGVFSY